MICGGFFQSWSFERSFDWPPPCPHASACLCDSSLSGYFLCCEMMMTRRWCFLHWHQAVPGRKAQPLFVLTQCPSQSDHGAWSQTQHLPQGLKSPCSFQNMLSLGPYYSSSLISGRHHQSLLLYWDPWTFCESVDACASYSPCLKQSHPHHPYHIQRLLVFRLPLDQQVLLRGGPKKCQNLSLYHHTPPMASLC